MKGIKMLCAVLAVVFILGVNLSAQWGVKGGFNLSKFHSMETTEVDQKFLPGFQLGVFYNFNLSDTIHFQPEVLYIQKGTKFSETVNSVNVDYKIKIGYIEIPFLLKFNLRPGAGINPYLIAGPYVGFRVSAKAVAEAAGIKVTDDIEDEIKSTDVGLIGGVGFEFKMDSMPKFILAEIRYEYGMVDIIKDTDGKAKNGSIVFNVGVGL